MFSKYHFVSCSNIPRSFRKQQELSVWGAEITKTCIICFLVTYLRTTLKRNTQTYVHMFTFIHVSNTHAYTKSFQVTHSHVYALTPSPPPHTHSQRSVWYQPDPAHLDADVPSFRQENNLFRQKQNFPNIYPSPPSSSTI